MPRQRGWPRPAGHICIGLQLHRSPNRLSNSSKLLTAVAVLDADDMPSHADSSSSDGASNHQVNSFVVLGIGS